ncbi:MAG: transposase, partial [Flavobacteriales bacterium]|nr:transposase [Flavobacteriales bacterium]
MEPMRSVANMIGNHPNGIIAWARSRRTNGSLEAINGLFQVTRRRARGCTGLYHLRTVIFMIAGELDFTPI